MHSVNNGTLKSSKMVTYQDEDHFTKLDLWQKEFRLEAFCDEGEEFRIPTK